MWSVESQPKVRWNMSQYSGPNKQRRIRAESSWLCFSETLVDFGRNTRRYISEYNTLHTHRFESFRSCNFCYLPKQRNVLVRLSVGYSRAELGIHENSLYKLKTSH
jgi:hypothetical protein